MNINTIYKYQDQGMGDKIFIQNRYKVPKNIRKKSNNNNKNKDLNNIHFSLIFVGKVRVKIATLDCGRL